MNFSLNGLLKLTNTERMCTVFYIPIQKDSFVFAHCRDERYSRPQAIQPNFRDFSGNRVFAPIDPQGGGTWFCMDENRIACILNGAFNNHKPSPPYKHSRGLIIKYLYEYFRIEEFLREYDFEGIEPFTLIVIENQRLFEVRWDGNVLYTSTPDTCKARIYSSPTLYDKAKCDEREGWFKDWLSGFRFPNTDDLLEFIYDSQKKDPQDGFIMKRPGISQTVSVTIVTKGIDETQLTYLDLISDSKVGQTLHF